MQEIVRIVRPEAVAPRELWAHEAHDFTPWLAKNIDLLGEAVGVQFSEDLETEVTSVGDFRPDIVASVGESTVIVENQLDPSDHKHLGQLISYTRAYGAKKAIWVTPQPRTDHINDIAWLNEQVTDVEFYLVQVSAFRVGEDTAVPQIVKVAGPSAQTEVVKRDKAEINERANMWREFWAQLLEQLNAVTSRFANITPPRENWMRAAAGGIGGVGFMISLNKQRLRLELYIETPNGLERNHQMFDRLMAHKEKIERSFGDSLTWEPLEQRKACRISYVAVYGDYRDPDQWQRLINGAVEMFPKFEGALQPRLRELQGNP